MSSDARFRLFCVIAFACSVAPGLANTAQGQSPPPPPSSAADSKARAELSQIIAGLLSDTSSHMRMGPTRTATAADSVRAAAIVLIARAALSQYLDVKAAERDGYQRNLPWVEDQPIYHYNRLENFRAAERGEFDFGKPVSLLYKKDNLGELRLFGAMYGTSASAATEQLDTLLPISMAHWHKHVNMCYPGRAVPRDGPRKVDAGTVFLVKLYFSITSAGQCETAGGQFVPVEFGWMAHVYIFAGSDDPKVIWDADDLGNMDMHVRHP